MMAEKARLFNDKDILKKIMDTNDPGKQKSIGQKVRIFIQPVWDDKRFDIVVKGNIAKFLKIRK